MSTIATSGRCSSTALQQLLRARRLRHHVDPGAAQDRDDARPDEQAVLRDHDTHGSSAVTVVPAPGGLTTRRLAVERLDAVGEAAQARAGGVVGAADAVVGDLDARQRARLPDAHRDARRLRVLADVGQRLGGDEVRGQLDRLGEAAGRLVGDRGVDGRARREPLQRRGQPVLEHRRVEPARELAQLGHRQRELVARRRHELLRRRVVVDAALQQAQLERDRDEPLLGAVVEVALEPAALGVARRHDPLARRPQLHDARAQLGLEALALDRDVRGRAHHLQQLRLVRQRRVVDERGDVLAVVVDERHRPPRARLGQRHRRPVGVDVGVEARQPVGEHERRVAERLRQHLAEPRESGALLERDDEVAHAGARELLGEHAEQERERHRHEQDGGDLLARADELAGDQRVVDLDDQDEGGERARQRRQQQPPQRRRGAQPARDADDRQRQAERPAAEALEAVDACWRGPGRPRSGTRSPGRRGTGRTAATRTAAPRW